MPVPLEDSLDEHAFDGEFAALPESHDPLADLDRGHRLQRTQRRRRAVALGCVTAALATAGLILAPSIGERTAVPAGPVQTASAHPAPAISPSPTPPTSTTTPGDRPQHGSCIGTVRLVGPTGEVVQLAPDSTSTVRLRVDDVLRLEADGRCGSAVLLSSQNESVLRAVDRHTVKAVKVGSTRLSAGHAMCADLPQAQQPGCIGGFASDGEVDVMVAPS